MKNNRDLFEEAYINWLNSSDLGWDFTPEMIKSLRENNFYVTDDESLNMAWVGWQLATGDK